MKKSWMIINILVIAAVAALYILYFTGGRPVSKGENKQSENALNKGDFSKDIYYINFDTVLANYDMYIDLQDQLEKMAKTSEAELAAKDKAFQKEVADYQQQMQKGLLLRSEAQEREQQLATIQQQLLKLQENLRLDLTEQQLVANRKVLDSIMKYLSEIQHQYNYKIVLGTQFGGGVLYADEELDITQRVIKGLNEKYKKNRTEKKEK
ncbi:MAG: OmpH family outer membrane protein [Bacteroidales bacterium]|nr:OmpH family outer membrane protein [Bacteroidales bacterium]